MFGEKLDYLLLRPAVHDANRATEKELDRQGCSSLTPQQMGTKLPRIIERFEGHFPIRPGLRYLDMGCGSGELTLGLCKPGLDHVVGVDMLPRFIERARQCARRRHAGSGRILLRGPALVGAGGAFDVAISFDAFEHIDNPRQFLRTMARLLAPEGAAVVSFSPLFHAPFGDHMGKFFRVQLPWRGAPFAEGAIMRLRREFYRPTDPATRYPQVAGGLYLMRYSQFLRYAAETGGRFRFLRTNTFLPSAPLRAISSTVCRIPAIRDYFIHDVYAVMIRI